MNRTKGDLLLLATVLLFALAELAFFALKSIVTGMLLLAASIVTLVLTLCRWGRGE